MAYPRRNLPAEIAGGHLGLLIELVPFWSVERVELTDCLCGESPPVDQKENSPDEFRFQQTINLRDSEKRFARTGRHCNHHVSFPADHRLLDRKDAVALIGTKPCLSVPAECRAGKFVPAEVSLVKIPFFECLRRVEIAQLAKRQVFAGDYPDAKPAFHCSHRGKEPEIRSTDRLQRRLRARIALPARAHSGGLL